VILHVLHPLFLPSALFPYPAKINRLAFKEPPAVWICLFSKSSCENRHLIRGFSLAHPHACTHAHAHTREHARTEWEFLVMTSLPAYVSAIERLNQDRLREESFSWRKTERGDAVFRTSRTRQVVVKCKSRWRIWIYSVFANFAKTEFKSASLLEVLHRRCLETLRKSWCYNAILMHRVACRIVSPKETWSIKCDIWITFKFPGESNKDPRCGFPAEIKRRDLGSSAKWWTDLSWSGAFRIHISRLAPNTRRVVFIEDHPLTVNVLSTCPRILTARRIY